MIQIYLAQGFRRFLLLTGYQGEQIEAFVAAQRVARGCRDPLPGDRRRHADRRARCTGPRRRSTAERRSASTYADGVADIDLGALLGSTPITARAATMTVVRPELPFGVAELDGDGVVRGFAEKPRSDHWVNGGFFCFERAALDCSTPDSVLEREPLERLAAAGQLRAFRHEGFWECMDTYKDAVALNDLWAEGRAPWKLWD